MKVPFRGSRPRSGSLNRGQLVKANLNPDTLDARQVTGFFEALGYPELNTKLPDSYTITQSLINTLNQKSTISAKVADALRDIWHSDNLARCYGPVPKGLLRIFMSLIPRTTQAEIARGMMLAAQMNIKTLQSLNPGDNEVDCEKEVEVLLKLNSGLNRVTLFATRQNTLELQSTKNTLIKNVTTLSQMCTETLSQLKQYK